MSASTFAYYVCDISACALEEVMLPSVDKYLNLLGGMDGLMDELTHHSVLIILRERREDCLVGT